MNANRNPGIAPGERQPRRFNETRLWLMLMAGFVAMLSVIYLRFVLLAGVDHDEVEHLHVGYRILHGLLPYRDFYQNHWPVYWLATSQFARIFPFSLEAILAGRILATLALAGSWLFGFLLLRQFRGGKTWLAILIYTWTVILVAYQVEFYVARPDSLMTLFATAGLCLIPARGNLKSGLALLLGVLFGIAVSLSSKIAPLVLVVPALVLIHCVRDRSARPAFAALTYFFGIVLALFPTALWLTENSLWGAFDFDVRGLNLALSKSWHESFMFLFVPVYLGSILGTLSWLAVLRRQSDRDRNGPWVVALAMAAGLLLALIARHTDVYNLQALLIPVAVGFTRLTTLLWFRTRGFPYRLLLVAALLGFQTTHSGMPLVNLKTPKWRVSQAELQKMMDLARPGNRTCIAFSPSHPVFCRDVGTLANRWDLIFPVSIRDPDQLARFHRIWHEDIKRTLQHPPDIILRNDSIGTWDRALEHGLITRTELQALDRLKPGYEVRQIGSNELWVRRQ